MESSDESFLWTDASNDCNSDSKMSREENCDNESESGYSYKKKLQKKLFNGGEENGLQEGDTKKKSKKRKYSNIDITDLDESKRKHIKSEPESDLDKQHKKNKYPILDCDNTLNDEGFLNYKVKEEQMSSEINSLNVKKKKKKKHREFIAGCHGDESESNAFGSYPKEDGITEFESGLNKCNVKEEIDTESNRLKKKKAKKKKNKEYNENSVMEEDKITEETVEDDNTMDTTILDKLCKIESKTQNVTNNNELYENSQSFVDNDDEGEISKINSSPVNAQKKIKIAFSQNGDKNDITLSCGGKISQKISERIRFEDEESSEFYNNSKIYNRNGTQYSPYFQKYLKRNGHLTDISLSNESNCVISEDDEVWVLKCPSDIDVKNLKDSSLVIDTKCKLKFESQTYVGFSESHINNMTILTINHSKPVIKNIPLNGLIHLHKRIPKAHFVEDNNVINNQTNFIPLPDTKCRHPLFGVNYKNAIKVPKQVAERLHGLESVSVLDNVNGKPKKVKKKQKIKINLSDIEAEAKTEPEFRPKKKKRKRSHDSATPPKSPKRRKHGPESAETWDSEKAIEQQLFNF